jgi:hypothetical protein
MLGIPFTAVRRLIAEGQLSATRVGRILQRCAIPGIYTPTGKAVGFPNRPGGKITRSEGRVVASVRATRSPARRKRSAQSPTGDIRHCQTQRDRPRVVHWPGGCHPRQEPSVLTESSGLPISPSLRCQSRPKRCHRDLRHSHPRRERIRILCGRD